MVKATLNDIARKVGVSKSLVSMYLNNHKLAGRIANDTKNRIDSAVRELKYQPSFAARALCNGKTKTIGMICGGIKNPYFAYLVEDAMEEAAKSGYQLLLSLTRWIPEEEEKALENLLNRQIDGLICCIEADEGTRAYELLRNAPIPVLFLNYPDPNFFSVCADLKPAMLEALRLLAGHGCRTVYGCFYEKSLWPSAFSSACAELGLKMEFLRESWDDRTVAEFVRKVVTENDHGYVFNGYRMRSRMLREFRRYPDYCPEVVAGVDDYTIMEDSDYVVGGIYTDTPAEIRLAVNLLLAAVREPQEQRILDLKSVFLTKEEVRARQRLLADSIRVPFPNF
ncbi:MAG: LacI family DNA-binding transcriptional regulator [Victivallales bacterium]